MDVGRVARVAVGEGRRHGGAAGLADAEAEEGELEARRDLGAAEDERELPLALPLRRRERRRAAAAAVPDARRAARHDEVPGPRRLALEGLLRLVDALERDAVAEERVERVERLDLAGKGRFNVAST